ncbi:MAG: HAMP domain-containing sensor histidine kinase [bacterium]|jgi:signal transduction histidine kinase
MLRRIRGTRPLQIGVIALLVTCVAQVFYWVVEEAAHTGEVRDTMAAEYASGLPVAELLLGFGVAPAEVAALMPHLDILGGAPEVAREDLASLTSARVRRLNRYGAEGTFFLVALLASMGIVAQALRQRAELLRRQENFIAAVSHEFKSPLASIKLAAETLLIREPDAYSTRRMADRMVNDVDRLEIMVSNTLDASRITEGRLVLDPAPIELSHAIDAVLGLGACRAHIQGVEVTSSVAPGFFAYCDSRALEIVIRNLVSNAVKSVTQAGGGKVRVHAEREGRGVRIDVIDDGVGFHQREAKKLFEKFYRPGDELRRRTKGSGLGLFIVLRFVEESGGRISANSPGEGGGAVFSVWLPGAEGEAA